MAAGFVFFPGPKVAAAAPTNVVTSHYPRQGLWGWLSTYACPGHCLTTPHNSFRVFYKADSLSAGQKLSVTITILCRGTGQAGGGLNFNEGGDTAKWPSCSSFNQKPTPITLTINASQLHSNANVYGVTYKYADLDLTVSNTEPPLAVQIDASDNGKITFQEDTDPSTPFPDTNNYTGHGSGAQPQNAPYQISHGQQDTALALWDNTPSAPEFHDIPLYFRTDCTVNNPESVSLRWYDADQDTSTNDNAHITFDLQDTTTGKYVFKAFDNASGGGLGGNDSYREVRFKIKPGDNYAWTWHKIAGSNGLQVWMPFSEFNTQLNCNPPKGKVVEAFCKAKAGVNEADVLMKAHDPDYGFNGDGKGGQPVKVSIYGKVYNGGSANGTHLSNPDTNTAVYANPDSPSSSYLIAGPQLADSAVPSVYKSTDDDGYKDWQDDNGSAWADFVSANQG